MDCLQIDWGNVMADCTFERDEFYESIQAPKWIDFTAPLAPVDDDEWFCGSASGCNHGKKSFVIPTHDDVVTDVIENSTSATGKRERRLLVSTSLSSLSEVTANVHKSLHPFPPIPESKTLESKMKKPIHQQQIASENVNPNQVKVAKKPPKTNNSSTTAKKTKVSDINNDTTGKESRIHALGMSREHRIFNNKIGINSEKEATIVAISKTIARKKDGIVEPCKTQTPKKQQQVLGGIQYLNRSKNVDEGGSSFSTRPVARNHHLMASLSMPLNRSIKSLHSDYVHSKDEEFATRIMTSKVGTKPKQCKSVGDGGKEDTLHALVGNESIKNETSNRHTSVPMMENERKGRLMKTLEDDKGSEEKSCSYIQETLSKSPHVLDEVLIDPVTVSANKSSIMREENEGVFLQEIHLITSQPSQEEVMQKPNACSYQCNQATTNSNSTESNLEELFLNNLSLNEVPSLHCDNTFEQQNLQQQYLSIHAQQEDMDEVESMRCSSQSGLSSCEIMNSKLIINPSHLPSDQDGNCGVSLARSISAEETISIQSSVKEPETKQSSTFDWQTLCGSKRRKNSGVDFKVNCNSTTHKYHKHEVQKAHKNRTFTNHPSSSNSQTKKTTTASNTLIKPFRLRTEERGAGSGRKKGFVRRSNTEELVEKALRIQSSAHQLFRPQRSTKKLTVPREPKFHQSARSRRECIANGVTKHSSSCEK